MKPDRLKVEEIFQKAENCFKGDPNFDSVLFLAIKNAVKQELVDYIAGARGEAIGWTWGHAQDMTKNGESIQDISGLDLFDQLRHDFEYVMGIIE